jgi:hypothetical protein
MLPDGDRARVVNKAMADAGAIQDANGDAFLSAWWSRAEKLLRCAYWLDGRGRPKNVYQVWSSIRAKASEGVRVGDQVVDVTVKTKGAWK